MQKSNTPQENKKETKLVAPIEGQNVRTTLNVQKSVIEEIMRIGASKNLTITAMTNEAFRDYGAKMNSVQKIDQMIRDTNGFWYERNLERVTQILPIETAKKLLPYQIAYLYCNLKDMGDRERVFTALSLTDESSQINALNGILQKASIYDGDSLKGYNIYQMAIDLKAKLTPLQIDYLRMKVGTESLTTLKERRPDIFPEITLIAESEEPTTVESEELGNLFE